MLYTMSMHFPPILIVIRTWRSRRNWRVSWRAMPTRFSHARKRARIMGISRITQPVTILVIVGLAFAATIGVAFAASGSWYENGSSMSGAHSGFGLNENYWLYSDTC